jgi:glutamine amidotransferase
VIDYGAGNLQSVHRRLVSVGAKVKVSSDPEQIANAEKIVLPGVGHFGNAMENLLARGLIEGLNEAVLGRGVPILGICLGMQLMASSSTEGEVRGLGWLKGSVVRFDVADHLRFKVPHMGWNQVRRAKDSALLQDIPDLSEFYFVHSYHYLPEREGDALLISDYAYPFTCAVEKDNIYGVQFHPEKSHEVGMKMLRNFVQL